MIAPFFVNETTVKVVPRENEKNLAQEPLRVGGGLYDERIFGHLPSDKIGNSGIDDPIHQIPALPSLFIFDPYKSFYLKHPSPFSSLSCIPIAYQLQTEKIIELDSQTAFLYIF